MPPKSANRSGKSTPTKGQSRGGEKDKKREEEEVKSQDGEEERKRAEKEERERLEREQKEKEQVAILEALELSRREQHLKWTEDRLTAIKKHADILANDKRAHAAWERYMRCDGSPDPTVLTQINTFINLTKETGKDDVNAILEEARNIYALIYELKFLLEDTPQEDITPEVEKQYKYTILALQDLLIHRYNEGTLKILKDATYEADTESGNLQKVIRGENEIILLWANLNKKPNFKMFTFESENFAFDLPKPLAMAEIAIRNLKTKYDLYSHQCSTFYPKPKKPKIPAAELPVKEEPKPEGEEKGKQEESQEGENVTTDEANSSTVDGRKSAQSEAPGSGKDGEGKADTVGSQQVEDASTPAPETKADEKEDELDDILDEDVVDLRQYQQLGGIFHVGLVKLPPQPTTVKGWTLRQVLDEPMTQVEYPSEAFAPKPISRVASAKEDTRDSDSPAKPLSEHQPPLGLTLKLPSDVMFFEEPQVAKWDSKDRHWKTSGIDDIEYNEETKTLSFKTKNFGIFCLIQDSHVNMPFQQWELKPLGQNHCLLTVTAAIAEAFIEIKGTECRLQAPEDVEARATELKHIYDKWMTPRDLMIALREAGINIFPAEDSGKYVSIQDKTLDLEEIYDQMALLSTAFAFCWSKWNASVTKKQIVLQASPWLGHGDTRKMEEPPTDVFVAPKPPAPRLTEDDWTLFMVDERRAHKLGLSEYDDEFSWKIAPGAEFHSDLTHALMETPFLERPNLPTNQLVSERVNSADKLYVHTMMIMLKAARCITYS